MNDVLSRAISQWRPSVAAQILVGICCAVAAVAVRFPVEPLLRGSVPYITFFPAVMIAALFVGRTSGLVCLISSAVLSAYFFVPPAMSFKIGSQGGFGILVFVLSGGLICFLALQLRQALQVLSTAKEREQRVLAEQQALSSQRKARRLRRRRTACGPFSMPAARG
jgi:K+-sensing histidine kinase KdpD